MGLTPLTASNLPAGLSNPDLRVIYTSGGGRTDGMAALFVEEATFLTKPYTNDQLIEAVETALRDR